jgi:hypothetical protein
MIDYTHPNRTKSRRVRAGETVDLNTVLAQQIADRKAAEARKRVARLRSRG